MPHLLSHLLFLCIALIVLLLPLRVQAALPKELPAAPEKFLTGACLTRSEDLWITAEAGGCNAPHLSRAALRKSGKKVYFRDLRESVMPG